MLAELGKLFCCKEAPNPVINLTFNPLKNPFVVNVDFDNTIYDKNTDILLLVLQSASIPQTIFEARYGIIFTIEEDPSCENFIKGILPSKSIPQGIYHIYYLRNKSSGRLECLVKSRPFPYGNSNNHVIWINHNIAFKFPSPYKNKGYLRKTESILSGTTCSEINSKSFLSQRKLSSTLSKDNSLKTKMRGRKTVYKENNQVIENSINKIMCKNPFHRRYCSSMVDPNAQSLSAKENPFILKGECNKMSQRIDSIQSENVISSNETN